MLTQRNIEVKTVVSDLPKFYELTKNLCDGKEPEISVERDTFFNSFKGRLKLKEFGGLEARSAELIFYERPEKTGPNLSEFSKSYITDIDEVKNVLANALGVKAELHKVRSRFTKGPVKIQFDEVREVGSFLKIEVNLHDDQTLEDGEKIIRSLLENLGIPNEDLISGSYVDILNKHL